MIITKPTGQLRHQQAVRKSAPNIESARATLAAHLALAAGEPIPVHKAAPDQAARDSGVCSGCTGRADEIVRHMESRGRSRVPALLIVAAVLLVAFVVIREFAK